MSFTFTDTPLAGDLIATSQADLKNNFNYEQVAWNKDHQVAFSSTANATPGQGTLGEGRHRHVSFLEGGANPTLQILDDMETMLWSHGGNLFFRTAKGDGLGPYQMTLPLNPANFGANPNGWTFLPGKVVLQYGREINRVPAPVVGTVSVTLPIAFPTAVFSIFVTNLVNSFAPVIDFNALIPVGPAASFTVRVFPPATPLVSFYWVAIGN